MNSTLPTPSKEQIALLEPFDHLGLDRISLVSTAQPARVGELIGLIDVLVKEGGTQFYMEILSCHGTRQAPPAKAAEMHADADADEGDDD